MYLWHVALDGTTMQRWFYIVAPDAVVALEIAEKLTDKKGLPVSSLERKQIIDGIASESE